MKRISMHRLQELVRLHRMGTGAREAARMLGMGPNTERIYREGLQRAQMLQGPVDALPSSETLKDIVIKYLESKPRIQHVSSIERWFSQIIEMTDQGARPKAIYDRLKRENQDFDGSLSAVKRAYKRIRKTKPIRAEDVAIPVETDPGEVAQVDFGYVGKLFDPVQRVMRKAYVFVMVLGYSRHMFCAISFDQKVETWLRLHVEAFEWFGGVPRVVVPDNLKAAVIRAAFAVSEPTILNRSYCELARHYGFKIDPTPVYSPKKKGKVESSVKYVKNNFFKSMTEQDAGILDQQLDQWVLQTAGLRTHGTTGRQPLKVFEQHERGELLPLPPRRFEPVIWQKATVHPDAHISFGKALYSAPWQWVGKQVLVRATAHSVCVFGDEARLATHSRVEPGRKQTAEEHLPPHRRDLRHRSHSYWLQRASAIDPGVGRYIAEVFDSDDVLEQLRTVQAMVTHLETFPRHRAVAACERARFYGNYSYRGIKNILCKALDQQPLPAALLPPTGAIEQPRYARNIRELIDLSTQIDEVNHGYN